MLPQAAEVFASHGAPWIRVTAAATATTTTGTTNDVATAATAASVAVDDEARGVLSGDGPAAAAKRTAALAQLFASCARCPGRRSGAASSSLLVPMLAGWRDEPFAVRKSFHADAACVVERRGAAAGGARLRRFLQWLRLRRLPGGPRGGVGRAPVGEEADVAGAAGLGRCGGWQQASCPSRPCAESSPRRPASKGRCSRGQVRLLRVLPGLLGGRMGTQGALSLS